MKLTLHRLSTLILISYALTLSSCKDIIEPSITGRMVSLEAPAEGYQSTSYAVSFWWDEVEDALQYHVQVVSGTFTSPGTLALDTLVSGYKLTASLSPGAYQWRVRAENGSSQTAYSAPRSFSVANTSLKQQKVLLSGPANNLITNQGVISFNWGSLYGATRYRLQLDTNNFTRDTVVIANQVTPGQTLKYTLSKDQTYQWRVRAENDTAQSQWSAIGYFTYDHTPPGKVSLTAPTNGSSVSRPVSLQWGQAATAVKYKLYLYQGDSTTVYNSTFPVLLPAAGYSFNLGNLNDRIYWRVSALDAAGNEGPMSELHSFILQ